jgi:hypothetical protein
LPKFADTFAVIVAGGKIVNEQMYIDILRRLRGSVRRKSPENWRTNSWVLIHGNVPAHRSALAKDLLAKNNVTTLEHSPYSSGLI